MSIFAFPFCGLGVGWPAVSRAPLVLRTGHIVKHKVYGCFAWSTSRSREGLRWVERVWYGCGVSAQIGTEQQKPLRAPNRALRPGEIVAPSGGILRPFQKGQSGNPGGFAVGKYQDVRRLAADKSMHAMKRIIELMDDDDTRIAFMASTAVLERGIGKPRDHSEEEALASRISLEGLDKGERAVLAMLLQKALGLDKPAAAPGTTAVPAVIEGEATATDTPAQPE